MKVVVIGGTGLIGSKVVKILGEHGHEAVAASPNSGVNTLTGEGLAEVLTGASVVIDVSNSPSFADAAVMEFFTDVNSQLAQRTKRPRVWAITWPCRSSAVTRFPTAATCGRKLRRRN